MSEIVTRIPVVSNDRRIPVAGTAAAELVDLEALEETMGEVRAADLTTEAPEIDAPTLVVTDEFAVAPDGPIYGTKENRPPRKAAGKPGCWGVATLRDVRHADCSGCKMRRSCYDAAQRPCRVGPHEAARRRHGGEPIRPELAPNAATLRARHLDAWRRRERKRAESQRERRAAEKRGEAESIRQEAEKRRKALVDAVEAPKPGRSLAQLRGRIDDILFWWIVKVRSPEGASLGDIAKFRSDRTGKPVSRYRARKAMARIAELEAPGGPWHQIS